MSAILYIYIELFRGGQLTISPANVIARSASTGNVTGAEGLPSQFRSTCCFSAFALSASPSSCALLWNHTPNGHGLSWRHVPQPYYAQFRSVISILYSSKIYQNSDWRNIVSLPSEMMIRGVNRSEQGRFWVGNYEICHLEKDANEQEIWATSTESTPWNVQNLRISALFTYHPPNSIIFAKNTSLVTIDSNDPNRQSTTWSSSTCDPWSKYLAIYMFE